MKKLTDNITSEDIKKMSEYELSQLAREIRRFMIKNVSETGGHLASNLGVVELTIALHKIFDFSHDKIVWDVGHQSYVHKILTGRAGRFSTLRQLDGISGFPKRSESEYDFFDSGHSSNSISAALGMAVSRDLSGDDSHIIAVIGDGALTGGMAYEALNNAGCAGTKLIVILNDNEMSISKNHGSMAQHLGKLRSSEGYNKFKSGIKKGLGNVPHVGRPVYSFLETIRDTVKYAILTEGVIFEELGLKYIGPINGHNISDMTEVLKDASAVDGPVLIHVLTKKGNGYTYAAKRPDKFHGIGAFDLSTGKEKGKDPNKLSYSAVFGNSMISLAEEDDKILAVSAAMLQGTGLDGFAAEFPKRTFDVGIAEAHAVTFACGLALSGYKPVVAVYSSFLQRAYDQILIDVCQQRAPVVFAVDRAGLVGADGETHNGVFDLSYFLPMPGITVMAPSSASELTLMLKYAVSLGSPAVVRYPRGDAFDDTGLCFKKPNLPKACVFREGRDVTIIAAGRFMKNALEVVEILDAMEIDAELIDPRVLKPFDEETILRSAKKTGVVVTIEDNVVTGGFGTCIADFLNSAGRNDIRVTILGWPDKFIHHGKTDELDRLYGLDVASIVKKVSEAVERKA